MRSHNFINRWGLLLFPALILLFSGCNKLVDINSPVTSISGRNVYSNDGTAIAVLTGIYTTMSQASIMGGDLTSIGFLTGLTSDELTLFDGNMDIGLAAYYKNMLSANLSGTDSWNSIYTRLYIINFAIEQLTQQNALTNKVRIQLLGEAKFLRALSYFYLLNLYGDVPLVISSDYAVNANLSRASKKQVWDQLISDLKDAQSILSEDYLDGTLLKTTTERLRPTKWAATALLARAYLYTEDWKNAELQSSNIIAQTARYGLSDSLNDVFKNASREAIWQLQPVLTGWNTEDAKAYIIPADYGPNGASGVYLSGQLLNSFEVNDLRKRKWINTISYSGIIYSYAYKYTRNTYGDIIDEYNTILRLSEQYLIRAEARTMENNIQGAREDLKIIRQRAGLPNTTAINKDELLEAILHERQVELFTEFGHRWFDLKRTNTINKTMSLVTPLKGGIWSANWQLFPIPLYDIQTNINIKQNIGY
ncbi:hypothetical protein QFZ48_003770 [Chitinophaga sp. W2I13]|uniref:RagB/SusD family nutrient uptake outer membrane protein n=1 Tax=Chitinophaga sp. W2I13 TaxID=3373923 RepID=UPI003D24342B